MESATDNRMMIMNEPVRINWYRCKVDKSVMSQLIKRNDFLAFRQAILQLALFALTGTVTYLIFQNITAANALWTVPLLLFALCLHGANCGFMGLVAVHELCHKTPFSSPFWNEFFIKIYSFLSWSDYLGFRVSHVKHHQATVHHDYDGEVVLPQKFDWDCIKFLMSKLFFSPSEVYILLRFWFYAAFGSIKDGTFSGEWMNKVVPESNIALRRQHRTWARILVGGQLLLATLFIITGHWFLIVIVNLSAFYSHWLVTLCGAPQHAGLRPDVADFRLCCRTYTCSWPIAFLYWNMQYHVEHHMFPAVPFYNLGKLREAISHDLPPAPHGLWAVWKELMPILRKQREDPNYYFTPRLPTKSTGETAAIEILESGVVA